MTEAKRQWLRKHRPERFRWLCRGGRTYYELTHPKCQPIPYPSEYRWGTRLHFYSGDYQFKTKWSKEQ